MEGRGREGGGGEGETGGMWRDHDNHTQTNDIERDIGRKVERDGASERERERKRGRGMERVREKERERGGERDRASESNKKERNGDGRHKERPRRPLPKGLPRVSVPALRPGEWGLHNQYAIGQSGTNTAVPSLHKRPHDW
ncbi:unnamed protein product, partial [Gadus morhua 'NCC']